MEMPKDPFMLLSMVNMKLRDGGYAGLDDFCKSEGIDKQALVSTLSAAGFDYLPEVGQFR